MNPQRLGSDLPSRIVSHQPLVAFAVLMDDDRRPTHIGMADQSCLDLSQLDPVSTNLHLEVVTPQKLDLAIRHPPAQITCLVHPTTRFTAKGVRKKSLGRQPGPIEIT